VRKYLVGQLSGRFADKFLENFHWVKENLWFKDLLEGLCEQKEWEKGVGLVGDVGVGKTHLLSALYKNRVWWSVIAGGRVPVWVTFSDLVAECYEDKSFLREFVEMYDLFFVDDIGSVGMDLREMNVLRELVFRIYDKSKVFCYTSNLSRDNWNVDERVVDRLREICVEIVVRGKSFREGM
jgi:DNA replication protein DnaC